MAKRRKSATAQKEAARAQATNSVRIPNKKRGRPKEQHSPYKIMRDLARSRNWADMVNGARLWSNRTEDPELWKLADSHKFPVTALYYLARIRKEDRAHALELLRWCGARYLKRLVECQSRPPTVERIQERLLRWLEIEFPIDDYWTIVAALEQATAELRAEAIAATVTRSESKGKFTP